MNIFWKTSSPENQFSTKVFYYIGAKKTLPREKSSETFKKPNVGIVLRLWLFQFDWHFFRWNRKLQINTLSRYLVVYCISPWMNYKGTREKHISSILLWFSKMERFQALIQAIFRKHCHFPTWSQGWKKYICTRFFGPPSIIMPKTLFYAKCVNCETCLRDICNLRAILPAAW